MLNLSNGRPTYTKLPHFEHFSFASSCHHSTNYTTPDSIWSGEIEIKHHSFTLSGGTKIFVCVRGIIKGTTVGGGGKNQTSTKICWFLSFCWFCQGNMWEGTASKGGGENVLLVLVPPLFIPLWKRPMIGYQPVAQWKTGLLLSQVDKVDKPS